MMDRYIEHELMELCGKYGIGITPFSLLAFYLRIIIFQSDCSTSSRLEVKDYLIVFQNYSIRHNNPVLSSTLPQKILPA